MASRAINKLSSRTIQTRKTPGWYGDGGGLYLRIKPPGKEAEEGDIGSKQWVFVFQWRGKRREMGFGPLADVDLAAARDLRDWARPLVEKGIDPVEQRRLDDLAREQAEKGVPTFGVIAEDLIDALKSGWVGPRQEPQWRQSLKTYGASIWNKPINEVGTEHVLTCLKPIWSAKPETADRVRRRIEHVLDAGRVQGHIQGAWENPARWKGHLARLLPASGRKERQHHPAMPYGEMQAFLPLLRARGGQAAIALELTILCGLRTTEVLGARWGEIDFNAKVWTVPAERMKGVKGKRRPHRVPLSAKADEMLRDLMGEEKPDAKAPLFPGSGKAGRLSNMSMEMVLRRMKLDHYTVHGFRSTFRDWAGDCTSFPREVIEAALAHVAGDDVEQAYRRGDALEKRRKLMEAWAGYLSRAAASNVREFKRPA